MNRLKLRHLMLCCGAVVACGWAGTAAAQTEAQLAPAASEDGADAAPADGGEILVTARRKSERLQDVPLAVTAFSPAALQAQNIQEVADLAQRSPSLLVTPNQGRKAAASYSLRGQGQTDTTLNLDPAVGVNLGEVPLASAYGVNVIGFLDPEAVEVLKGPQGTLFGRNTTGGVINIRPATPNFGAAEGEIRLGVGNYDRRIVTAHYNLPVNEYVAIRAAGEFNDRDGLYNNLAGKTAALGFPASPAKPDLGDDHYGAGRLSLRFKSGAFDSTLVGDYTKMTELGSSPAANGRSGPGPAALAGILTGYTNFSKLVQAGKVVTYNAGRNEPQFAAVDPIASPFSDVKLYGITNITTLELSDDFSLKNIIAFRKLKIEDYNDNDGSPFPLLDSHSFASQKQFSNEFQVQYASPDFDVIAGLFYQRAPGRDGSIAVQGGALAVSDGTFLNKSYAAFAQADIKLIPKVDITVGGRVTHDKRSFSVTNFNPSTGLCNLVSADTGGVRLNPCVTARQTSFTEPTWTFAINYRPTREHTIYATARRGYRSGGYTLRATRPSELRPFQPETVDDIELGYKGNLTFGQSSLRLNVAAYRSKYNDAIRSQTRCGPATATSACPFTATIFVNAAKATINGLEIESTFAPVDWLELSGFFTYTDAKYDRWVADVVQAGTGIVFPATDLSDNRFARVPKTRGGGSARVRLPFGEDVGEVWLQGSVFSTAKYAAADINRVDDLGVPPAFQAGADPIVDGYTTYDARLDWDRIAGSDFSAGLWVRNLTNREYFTGKFVTPNLGLQTAFYGEPRTYGLDVTFRF